MLKGGFLGTAAPAYADLVLFFEIAMGLALLIGAVFARMRRYRLHAWCQSVVVLLNLAVILAVMAPSFRVRVAPKIPAKLGQATTHWRRCMRHWEALQKSAGCTFCSRLARTYCLRDSASPNTNYGCAASSCSGGSCSCWDWQHTPAGTPHTHFVNESATPPVPFLQSLCFIP
jgi:hypothetical protein